MTNVAEYYCGKAPKGCVEGPPKCPTPDIRFSNVCHRHVRIPQWKIITCSASSIFVGFATGVLLSWINYAEQNSINGKWSFLNNKLDAFLSETGVFPYFVLVVFVLTWHLATVFACHRQYTSISDYIIVSLTVPIAGLTALTPVVGSIIE